LVAAPLLQNHGVLSTFSDESLNTLLWNFIGGLSLVAYSGVTAAVHFWILDRLGVLRVPVNDEIRGLDVKKHNEPAYGYGMLGTKL
jgi:ammonia channel protein AmtB